MNGLNNRGVEDMRRLFLGLREDGVTILMASHNPLDIRALCDTISKWTQACSRSGADDRDPTCKPQVLPVFGGQLSHYF